MEHWLPNKSSFSEIEYIKNTYKMNKDLSLVLWLHDNKITLSHLRFLEEYYKGTQDFLPPKHKLKTELEKFGFIYDEQITEKGKDLFIQAENWDGIYTPTKKKVQKEYSEEFLVFWENFPPTDNFSINGNHFAGVRTLRKNKDQVYTKYQQITKHISPIELLNALQYEVEFRKHDSLKKNQNQLTYMSGVDIWLKNRKFEVFLGKGKFKSENTGRVQHLKIAF